jgi:Hydrazine synthase alpha subunit middle domain
MTRVLRAALAAFPFLLVVLLCGFSTKTASVSAVPILVTSAPAYDPLAGLHGADRFPKGAQLLMVRDGKAETLVADFAASADASVSFDAKTVLFSGKKAESDCWQIWELTLADGSVRQVTSGGPDAVRPLYLPGRRLVFARRAAQGFQLVAADLDGKNELPLTYMPASAIPADVLADGRILFEAGYPLGSGNTAELFLVYSDGSGVESYRCDHGPSSGPGRWGGRQLASGDVVFTHGASLARFTSPLAHEERTAAPRADYAGGVVETLDGAWVLSVRSPASAPYALKLWRPSAAAAGGAAMTPVLSRAEENLVEPVLLAPRERPKQHPSSLHDWTYANLLALDARASREGDLKTVPAKVRLETMDVAGHAIAMGTTQVESDGSFFVKAPADQPIRFVLLDAKGMGVRQEHGWFWIRRGEQRVCVGCHTGPERAAENNVPAVLLRSTNPTDLTGARSPGAAMQALKESRR